MVDPEKLKQFIDITGANDVTAKFFLGAANHEVDSAVNAFFEADGMIPPGSVHPTGATPAPTTRPTPSAPVPAPAPSGGAGPSAPAPSRRAPTGGIATLASLGGGDEDDDESGKNYYAGGEKSGQMIQDPRDRDRPSNPDGDGVPENDRRLAEAILERARQRVGAMDDTERDRFSENQRFTGAGYRLGDEAAAAANNGAPAAPSVVGRRNVTRTITFYDNGFVVDDGELRGYDDPANAAFLADVNKGVVPREMEAPGVGDVSITLMDKKNEKYEPPKRRLVPFSGGGQTLSAAATGMNAVPAETTIDAAVATLSVDDTQPVALIQVRLSDGTRLRARLNESHTVADLRNFVQAARPGTQAFSLATTFPRKELTEETQSIKEAGLKGAVVVQTLK